MYFDWFLVPREKHSDLTLHPFCSVKTGKQIIFVISSRNVTCIMEIGHMSIGWLYIIDTRLNSHRLNEPAMCNRFPTLWVTLWECGGGGGLSKLLTLPSCELPPPMSIYPIAISLSNFHSVRLNMYIYRYINNRDSLQSNGNDEVKDL